MEHNRRTGRQQGRRRAREVILENDDIVPLIETTNDDTINQSEENVDVLLNSKSGNNEAEMRMTFFVSDESGEEAVERTAVLDRDAFVLTHFVGKGVPVRDVFPMPFFVSMKLSNAPQRNQDTDKTRRLEIRYSEANRLIPKKKDASAHIPEPKFTGLLCIVTDEADYLASSLYTRWCKCARRDNAPLPPKPQGLVHVLESSAFAPKPNITHANTHTRSCSATMLAGAGLLLCPCIGFGAVYMLLHAESLGKKGNVQAADQWRHRASWTFVVAMFVGVMLIFAGFVVIGR